MCSTTQFLTSQKFSTDPPELCDSLPPPPGPRWRINLRHPHPESSELLIAFQRAAVTGNISDLITLLHPDVTLRSDGGGIVRAAFNPIHGAEKVARFIIGVLKRQAATSFDITQGPLGEVATFTRGHTTSGVLELVTAADDHRATEVLIQWNPEKLQEWNQG